jgi:tyrosinase
MLTTSALKPFYSNPNGDFWTSNTCRDPRTMGYMYPEIASGSPSDVITAVNGLYGSSTPGQLSEMTKSKRKRFPSVTEGNATSSAQYLYQINFRAPKNEVDSSMFIDFFVGNGPVNEDPNTWLGDPNLIGSHAIIAMDNPGMPQVTITGVVMMNHYLQTMVAQGRLANMELDTVLTMLQDKIAWRIKTVSGNA